MFINTFMFFLSNPIMEDVKGLDNQNIRAGN